MTLNAIQGLAQARCAHAWKILDIRSSNDNSPLSDEQRESIEQGLLLMDSHLGLVRRVLKKIHIYSLAMKTILASMFYRVKMSIEAEFLMRYVVRLQEQIGNKVVRNRIHKSILSRKF